MSTVTRDRGFTLAELLVAIAIVGVISAIAIPIYASSLTNARNDAIEGSLSVVATSIETRVTTWNGRPPYSFGICNAAGIYPTDPAPSDSCVAGQWAAQRLGTSAPLEPPLGGALPDQVQVLGHMDATGRYCLDGSSQAAGTSTFYITEEMDAPAEGNCLTAGWTPESANLTPDIPIPTAPDAPTLLSYSDLGQGEVRVTWEGVAGTTYLLSLSGQLTPEPITVSTSGVVFYTFSGVSPGEYTLTIRARGSSSWGAPAMRTVYVAAPEIMIDSVSPNVGPTAGGTLVTVTGSNFIGATSVTVGGAEAQDLTVVSNNEITFVTPAGTSSQATIRIVTPRGTANSGALSFKYFAPPTISSVSPAFGPTAGGTSVRLTSATASLEIAYTTITIGGTPVTGLDYTREFGVVQENDVTFTTPPGTSGAKDIVVTTPGGTVTSTGGFTYVAAPTITSISPTSGTTAGNTLVTVNGTNLSNTSSVTVGGVAGTSLTNVSATRVTFRTPTGTAGARNIVLTTPGGSVTSGGGYTYVTPPTITSLSPTSGTTAGGTVVTLTGTNLTGTTLVTVGGVNATNIINDSATQIRFTTPAGTAGAKAVVVRTCPSCSVSRANAFTYS